MRRRKYVHFTKVELLLGISLLVIVVGALTYAVVRYVYNHRSTAIPQSIAQHVAFQIYVPSPTNKSWSALEPSVRYNSQTSVLSITTQTQAKTNDIILDEQPTPDVFTNIPQYYQSLLSKLNEYGQIQTNFGSAYLTHPTELHGGQTAVLNSSGTLLFARPLRSLSKSQWTAFFNDLIVDK